jgi:hypothetical protein
MHSEFLRQTGMQGHTIPSYKPRNPDLIELESILDLQIQRLRFSTHDVALLIIKLNLKVH